MGVSAQAAMDARFAMGPPAFDRSKRRYADQWSDGLTAPMDAARRTVLDPGMLRHAAADAAACPSSWAASSACCCASCRRAKSAWAISKRYSAFAAHVVAAARRAAQRRHSGHAARRQEYLLPCGRPQGLAGAGLAVPPLLPEGRRAMTINWNVFTPVSALFRGALIGLVTTLPLLLNGCVAGIATSSAACWSAWARGSARVIPSRPHFFSAYTSCVQRCAQRATPKRALTQTPASSGTRS